MPFQALVERTLRRGVAASDDTIPIHTDVPYGSPGSERGSSDVVLGDEGSPVFVEAVSGPLQAATLTRGDLDAYAADADRLIVGKASQLNCRIMEFFDRHVRFKGIDPGVTRRVWPVIVTSTRVPAPRHHRRGSRQPPEGGWTPRGRADRLLGDHLGAGARFVLAVDDLPTAAVIQLSFRVKRNKHRGAATLIKLPGAPGIGASEDRPVKRLEAEVQQQAPARRSSRSDPDAR